MKASANAKPLILSWRHDVLYCDLYAITWGLLSWFATNTHYPYWCYIRGGTPILEDGGELSLYWPQFLTFSDPIGSLSMPNSIILTPFFNKKLSFDTFEAICTNFLLDFRSCCPPFSLLLDLFEPSFLQTLRSRWVHYFHVCWTLPSLHRTFGEVPPPWCYIWHPEDSLGNLCPF